MTEQDRARDARAGALPRPEAELAGLLRIAGRSPSPHNTQPWAPRVVDGAVELAVVPSRTLPAGDPSARDLILALGAWTESFAIAAAARGWGVEVDLLPDLGRLADLPLHGPADHDRPVACLRLTDRPDPTPFTPEDVRGRAVARGALRAAPRALDDVSAARMPPWLSLRRLDESVMRGLTQLGFAYTVSRPSIAEELVRWLRLSPEHPGYWRDGMTDRMLGVPAPLARIAAPFTRRRRLRDPALAVAGAIGRAMEGLGRDAPIPRVRDRDAPENVVLVADARAAGSEGTLSHIETLESRIGIGEERAFEAGRVLQRLWLQASAAGAFVAPHSEAIDAPAANGRLRRHLGLRRSEVALAVFAVGRPAGPVARSPRLTDDDARRRPTVR